MYPSWDDYFIGLAYIVSARSKDESTKHGAIIVNQHNHILGVGYNGAIAQIDDSKIPQTRPEKYDYFIHAEQNAIWNCTAPPRNFESRIYITGPPCGICVSAISQVGIKEIIYGDQLCKDPTVCELSEILLDAVKRKNVQIRHHAFNPEWLLSRING